MRERKRERNINVREKPQLVVSHVHPDLTPARDQTHKQGMCPDQELNPQPFDI